jgi:cyclopropane-fatty-acyl-phospholipid synthase
MLLRSLLQTAIRQGAVRLVDTSNRTFLIGDGQAPVCTLRLKRRHLDWSIALNPSIRLAEAYMDGLIVIEDGTLYD